MDDLAELTTCRFDNFLLDPRVRGLFQFDAGHAPIPLPIGSRAIDILSLLIERRGTLVSRQEIMNAVWPNVAVEESNLTVQISALRRVLDEGRAGGSCIQTVPGRGYRFLPHITYAPDLSACRQISRCDSLPDATLPGSQASTEVAAVDPAGPPARHGRETARNGGLRRYWSIRIRWIAVTICLAAGALLGSLTWHAMHMPGTIDHPRLSLVVLPFQNLSGNPAEDYLADGITDDLTTDLSQIPQVFVIARESAYTYRGKRTDVRQIGRELGVRYVLEGSVRKLGTILRVNAQLVSTDSGLHVWSDRFDEQLNDLAAGQQRVVARMFGGLGINMVEIESKRGQRERPTNPDAFDLILQGRALLNLAHTPQRRADALALFERALLLDPESTLAMAAVAVLLLQPRTEYWYWTDIEVMTRADKLTTGALAIAPMFQFALRVQLSLLRAQERWQEATVAAQRFIDMFPNHPAGYIFLGFLRVWTGNAEQGIALTSKAIQINPLAPYVFNLYRDIGYASLMLGRDHDAIAAFERSLALNPDIGTFARQSVLRQMAAAYAQLGQDDQARRTLAEANRLFPFDTVRGHWPEDPTSEVYAGQIRRYQEGLRRAGLRDHADEDADFGVPADGELHQVLPGMTPMTAPGVRTIRTGELAVLLAEHKPLIIDLMAYFWGASIPGAVGLREAGAGGSFSGGGQDRLQRKITALTGGDLSKPIVAVGWNSERFDGRNFALRLVAMGYTNVYWYRGGREAWEVNGLPETRLTPTDW